MPRKPIPGRNINDSDADLYAEYHEPGARFSGSGSNGKNSTHSSRNSINSTPPEISHLKPLASLDTQVDAPVSPEMSPMMPISPLETNMGHPMSSPINSAIPVTPVPPKHHGTPAGDSIHSNMMSPIQRHHSHTDHVSHLHTRHHRQHMRNKSADWNWFVDQVPDLSGTIETDFSILYRSAPSQQQQQQQQHFTNRQQLHDTTHGLPTSSSASHISQHAETGSTPPHQSVTSSQSQPVLTSQTSQQNVLVNDAPDVAPQKGYNFSKFDVCYQEHR